jgi:hypothetical protein
MSDVQLHLTRTGVKFFELTDSELVCRIVT